MKKKRGRPELILDENEIVEMRMMGISCKKIADAMGVSEFVIRKNLIKNDALNVHKDMFERMIN